VVARVELEVLPRPPVLASRRPRTTAGHSGPETESAGWSLPGKPRGKMKGMVKKIFRLSPLTLSLAITAIIIAAYLFGFTYSEIMELKARDLRFTVRGKIRPGPEVVLAVIDEKSLDEIGRWPWPRARIAEVIRILDEDGAKVVGFDVGFVEPDQNSSLKLIQRLEERMSQERVSNPAVNKLLEKEYSEADNDKILADTIKNARMPVVLGYFLRIERDQTTAYVTEEDVQNNIDRLHDANYPFVRLSDPSIDLEKAGFPKAFMPVANIKLIGDAAASSGYMNMFQDIDGTVRWIPMIITIKDKQYLPLSLQTLRFALGGGENASLFVSRVGAERIDVGPYHLPTDEMGRFLVNYRGPAHTFPHVSMADILARRFKPGTFKDKIVLAGATAVGIYDLRTTPFATDYPGLEVHANVIDNILRQDFLTRPNWAAIFDLGAMLLVALLLGLVLPRLSAFLGLTFGLSVLAAETGVNYLFFLKGVWLNIVFPTLTVGLVYTGITVFRYVTEEREKRKIKGAFQTYVHPSVVNEMLKDPSRLKLGGEKKMLTVLFSDIKGFTSISEKMDPEELVNFLNEYLTAMTNLVFKYDGLLDKYIGDAVMAVYGTPLEVPNHPLQACRTGLDMQAKLAELREVWTKRDATLPKMEVRVGINTGIMIAGNIGSETRFDYTVIGDNVNLGSRLEGINKEYDTSIVISETTYEQVKEEMVCRELDLVAVKGKVQPVRIYELVGRVTEVPQERHQLIQAFSQGLRAYQVQDWERARKAFAQVDAHFPEDGPTQIFMERVDELRKNPPPKDWNGVYVMTTK